MAYMRESNSLRFHQLVALVATPSLVAPTSLRSVAVCQMFDPDNGPSPHPAGKLTLEISQIKVIEADLPNVGWHEHKERQYRIVVKIGQQRIKSKESEKSKRPKWNETYPFVDIDSTATFHLQLSVKTSLRRVPVADISETVQSILPSSRSSDASYIVTRDLASCPGAKLEFCVKVINADSFSPTIAVVLAEAENAVESLPAYHPLEIPTMRPSSPVVDTAQNFGQLLLPLLEKVKPFCDLMAAVSKVHPYAQIVWSLLDGVYTAVKNQVIRDGNIRELLRKMDSFYKVVNEHNEQIKSMKIPTIKSPIEFLQRVCAQTIECCFFIRSYASPGFLKRMLKSAVSNVDARITAYCDAFESLKQSFYKERQLNTELAVVRVLGAVQCSEIKADLNDMLYSRGSALDDEDKACLEGTREDMLNIATKWANCDLSPENR